MKATVWLYPGMAGWHFVSIPVALSKEITKLFGDKKRGWGSLPVTITVGSTSWNTSIFPDKKSAAYLLPIKAAIRKKEGIVSDGTINFLLEIRV